MIQDKIVNLLKDVIGLDANSIGTSAIMRAVEHRKRACGLDSVNQYWEHLNQHCLEQQALIEAVIIPETWFYRDREAYSATADILRKALQDRPSAPPLRILSLPCSTGEEPYTIAMSLLDAQIPQAAIHIEGIDISNHSLNCAKEGIYGRNSFRGNDLTYRDRHFTLEANGYRISDKVRSFVRFSQGNLFDLDRLTDGQFDIVFCRNLLIYFDAADQRRAAYMLNRLLAPTGTLFIGHSEANVLLREGFVSRRIPQAFAFQKMESVVHPAPLDTTNRLPKRQAVFQAPSRFTRSVPLSSPFKNKTSLAQTQPKTLPKLEDIQHAADRGELDAALQLGRDLIKAGEASSELLYMLALISEAKGADDNAADYYRRTLYLAPNHHEAMTHLTLMLRRAGDIEGAKRVEERARRLGERRDAT